MATNGDQSANLIKEYRHFVHEGLMFASRRRYELSHEFMRLELQISAMLFAFAGLLLGFIASLPNLYIRSGLAAVLFCLAASMACGLYHIKRNEQAWNDEVKDRQLKFNKWQQTIDRGGTFEEARAFHAGVSRGISEVISAPLWSWILQSAFLGLAVALLFGLALTFLFS
ncbi:hypothetical protein A3A39_04150 [Candidatus Kaiserbacteria bacterium RIFCSPLOWO2_01_FULL_54_13]|uniref:SMODS and SLOG-associating 2TM effector domain-containing protein n=1 Tax=Candidatus Kaiserbacteria bacterium RIFCSPLOWO2_01_FULL_54_13 TaxID=1798512 RepID=A0A1F6F3M0_9BACT|nr:MAG: hypothetical protein A3A39_04150 [Candidatus Kaiserbacteria bacterium RIFCSPLOWO2_01_FULL_54_13]